MAIPLTTIKLRREQVFGVAVCLSLCPAVPLGGRGAGVVLRQREVKGPDFTKVTSIHSSPIWLFLFWGVRGGRSGRLCFVSAF